MKREPDQLRQAEALKEVQQAFHEGWIKTEPLASDGVARLLEATLDPGQAEAIALALKSRADLILLDERDGRSAAERAGLRVTGLLGVLLRAKKHGIQALKWDSEVRQYVEQEIRSGPHVYLKHFHFKMFLGLSLEVVVEQEDSNVAKKCNLKKDDFFLPKRVLKRA